MTDIATLRTKVIGIVRDDSGKLVDPDDYDSKILAAIKQYSKYRPADLTEEFAGTGSHDYSLPETWEPGFSSINWIEFPAGRMPEVLVDPENWSLYKGPTEIKIRLIADAPSSSDKIRVNFTILQTAETLPAVDEDTLCLLAASFCLEDLANAFAQMSDSTIDADAVNYRSKSSEFAARAKRTLQLYKDHMGLKEDDTVAPASAVIDQDEKYPGGFERLTHPRWARRKR